VTLLKNNTQKGFSMKLKLISTAVLISFGFYFFNSEKTISQTSPQTPLFIKTPPQLKLGDPMPSNLFVELGKAINPAVVNISTSAIPKGRQYRDPMIEMMERFYGRPVTPPSAQSNKPQRMGLGTGFIIREDGLIVTNAHVVQGADLIEVQLTENSDRQYTATVIGSDDRTDIALLKIKPDIKLTAAALGNSESAEVGEWVAAFGNPYGHGHSMTKGIISSVGREIGEINRLPLIQTDASINPGNSGGPLVNAKGFVIGVNSAIDARAQGIGFAIPIDEVKKIVQQLEQRGSVRKGYLGVVLGDIDDQIAEQLGMDEYRGAVVIEVGDGPGRKAGLKTYDIITEFNGKKIKFSRDLVDQVFASEPNTKVKIKILRNEKTKTLDLVVGERPGEKQLARSSQADSDDESASKKNTPYNLGAMIEDSTPKTRQIFGVNDEVKNPIVTSVERNSLASRVGIRVGDVILNINGKSILTAKDAIKSFRKGANTLRVARGRGLSAMTFDIP
jgi:serine protease Do